jgi:membrane protein DedA with SNARE-associated domain
MAGLSNMRFSTFLLALICGAAPLGFTVAAVGYALSDRPVLIIALCALLPLPIWFVVRGASAVMDRKQLDIAGDTIGDDAR